MKQATDPDLLRAGIGREQVRAFYVAQLMNACSWGVPTKRAATVPGFRCTESKVARFFLKAIRNTHRVCVLVKLNSLKAERRCC